MFYLRWLNWRNLFVISTLYNLGAHLAYRSNLSSSLSSINNAHRIFLKGSADYNLKNAIEKIKARNAYLCDQNTDKSPWGWKTGGPPKFHKVPSTSASVISLLQPVYTCPWTLHRTNYVSSLTPKPQFDGGKWTCGLREMNERNTALSSTTTDSDKKLSCIVYSFGSNGDDFFEADVLLQNPSCEIHIFDPTSGDPPPSWEGKYHFHRSGLCVGDAVTSFTLNVANVLTDGGEKSTTYPCRSLGMHMAELGHDSIDILKADIEGMEWELIKQWDFAGVGQMLFEFHFWVKAPPLPELLRDYFIPLEKQGFFVHTLEPVAAEIEAFEITFLNVNWSPQHGIRKDILYTPDMYPVTPNVIL